MPLEEQLISIGYVVTTHGIKGSLKVQPLTDFPDRFQELYRVFIETEDNKVVTALVSSASWHQGNLIVSFCEWDDINQVLNFVGAYLKIPISERRALPKDSYYYDEIYGLQVIDIDGNNLGELYEIYYTGSNDVYLVKSNDKEFLLPALKSVIVDIDFDQMVMTVDLPEGLLDEE